MAERQSKDASVTAEADIIPDDQLPENMDERREVVAKHNAKKGTS